jgi:hypothetical protein
VFDEALAKCRGPIGSPMKKEILSLVDQVLKNSELRDLMEESSELKLWTNKVKSMLQRLRSI